MIQRDGVQADTEAMGGAAACEEVKSRGILGRLKLWVARNIVAEVPSDIARCEFECRVADCPPEKILACQRRIDYERMLVFSDTRPRQHSK